MLILALLLSFSSFADSFFPTLEASLKESQINRPSLLIDLDSLDHNIEAVTKTLPHEIQLRVVTKSLPSVDLLKYIMNKASTQKVMVFHHAFLPLLLKELPSDTEFLFGKPIPVQEAKEVLGTKGVERVYWLIDSPEVLEAYYATFKAADKKLKVCLEINVGMHRGGAEEAELVAMLDFARTHKDVIEVKGLMGYDGHVTHHPLPWKKPILNELDQVKQRYHEFVTVLNRYNDLRPKLGWTLNGAGSSTYSLYTKDDPINDASLGSAFLMSADFDKFTLAHHKPALYIATPVLKKIKDAKVPFLGNVGATFNRVFQKGMTGFYLYGGGWSDHVVYPNFLKMSSLVNSTPNRNIISNQAYVLGKVPEDSKFGVGSYVFFRPLQNDTLFLFEEIHLIRKGKLSGKWSPFPRRL